MVPLTANAEGNLEKLTTHNNNISIYMFNILVRVSVAIVSENERTVTNSKSCWML